MKKDVSKVLSIIQIITGAAVSGAILIWAPVCKGMLELANGNMTHMKCYYTGQAALLLAIVLIIAGVDSLLSKSRASWTFIGIGLAMISVTFASLFGIGVCTMPMQCHTTALWIRSGGALAVICGIIALFVGKQRLYN